MFRFSVAKRSGDLSLNIIEDSKDKDISSKLTKRNYI